MKKMNLIIILPIIFFNIILGSNHPTPPDIPAIEAFSDHGRIIIYWDRKAEGSIDPETDYADFEGYRLYKSDDGGTTWGKLSGKIFDYSGNLVGWKPLVQYDLSEEQDITRCIYSNAFKDDPGEPCKLSDKECDGDILNTIPPQSVDGSCIRNTIISGNDSLALWFNLGDNTYIQNYYEDTDVIDGVEYIYAVTAYDMGLRTYDIKYVAVDTIAAESFIDCGIDSCSVICETDENWKEEIGNGIYDDAEEFIDLGGNGVYDAEEFTDANCNLIYDPAEEFTDSNENGSYDAEVFMDCGVVAGILICETDENWEDKFGNGIYDAAEEFTDSNENGSYDAEEFTDANENGIYDISESFTDCGVVADTIICETDEGWVDEFGSGTWDFGDYFTDCGVVADTIICDTDEDWEDEFGNGIWDEGEEEFIDSNGNGVYEPAENYIDSNFDGQWNVAEEFEDENLNGIYDAEVFADINLNLIYDVAEEFEDENSNGVYDAEEFADINGNLIYDVAEEFEDENSNGVYDAEEFTDTNENGIWDPAEEFTDCVLLANEAMICETDNSWNPDYGNGVWNDDLIIYLPDTTWSSSNPDHFRGMNELGYPSFESPKFMESFTDYNANGMRDEDEPFQDVGNGIYDDGEEFIDSNNDGLYSVYCINDNFLNQESCVAADHEWIMEEFTDGVNGVWDQRIDPINVIKVIAGYYASNITFPDSTSDYELNKFIIPDDSNIGNGFRNFRIVNAFDLIDEGFVKFEIDACLNKDGYGDQSGSFATGCASQQIDCDAGCLEFGPPSLYAYNVEKKLEEFVDENGNEIYDFEEFTDSNGNLIYDSDEDFADENGNGIYDSEEFTDSNGNEIFDFIYVPVSSETVILSIADFSQDSILFYKGLPGAVFNEVDSTVILPNYLIYNHKLQFLDDPDFESNWTDWFNGVQLRFDNGSDFPPFGLDVTMRNAEASDSTLFDRILPRFRYKTNLEEFYSRPNYTYKIEFGHTAILDTAYNTIPFSACDHQIDGNGDEFNTPLPFKLTNLTLNQDVFLWHYDKGIEQGYIDYGEAYSLECDACDVSGEEICIWGDCVSRTGYKNCNWEHNENLHFTDIVYTTNSPNGDDKKLFELKLDFFFEEYAEYIGLSNDWYLTADWQAGADYFFSDCPNSQQYCPGIVWYNGMFYKTQMDIIDAEFPPSNWVDIDGDYINDNPWRALYPWKDGDYVIIEPYKWFVDGDSWVVDMSKLAAQDDNASDDLEKITVVPNPYMVNSIFNESPGNHRLRFTNLPYECNIKIYTISGELVDKISHYNKYDGNEWWDLRNGKGDLVAPGLYIYVVEAPGGGKIIDKFAVVR